MPIPSLRVRDVNHRPVQAGGDYVLYWMIAFRRTRWNFSLEHAVDLAQALKKPLLILEALRIGYPWASDRLHAFVIQGMAENQARLATKSVLYYPYVEPQPNAGQGLFEALAQNACAVVTDDFPCFFLPRMIEAAGQRIDVRLEAIDSNGIVPLQATLQIFTVAHSFRRWLQKNIRPHLVEFPEADSLTRVKLPTLEALPKAITKRWPEADVAALAKNPSLLSAFAIDHEVRPASILGGPRTAEATLKSFLSKKLDRYDADRNDPDRDASSGLSPYLHFGHLSAHQIFHDATAREGWTIEDIATKPTGKAQDWWNASPPLEAFLDQLITWREIGFNCCAHDLQYDRYESLPNWAQKTLAKHARDPRPQLYSLEELAAAETYDELWNASQRQLVREGRIHNYLRMLWGKKILEWSPSPREALDVMLELNNKYALDGRDPNSYSGIFWVLGRYDRAWGPERRIFGTVRYMSSDNTARKIKVKQYLERYSA